MHITVANMSRFAKGSYFEHIFQGASPGSMLIIADLTEHS